MRRKDQTTHRQALTAKMRQQGYLTVPEVAKLLSLDRSGVYKKLKRKVLRHQQVGDALFVELASLREYVGEAGAKVLGIPER